MNHVKRWSLAGTLAISIFGYLLHYVFSWTGGSKLIAWFVPVNESVWEHLKLGYGAMVLFSLLEYTQIKQYASNYFFAKTLGILVLELTILVLYYSTVFIAGHHIFWIDICSYFVGVIISQFLCYWLFKQKPYSGRINAVGVFACIAIGVLFAATTFYPPHMALFLDHNTHTYGIPH